MLYFLLQGFRTKNFTNKVHGEIIASWIWAILSFSFVLNACNPAIRIQVEDAWARPTLKGNNSAIYLVLDNKTAQNDRLLSMSVENFESVEIHQTISVSEHDQYSGVESEQIMKMSLKEFVVIPSKEKVHFEPGGLHFMLINALAKVNVGDSLSVTLFFEKEGEIQIQIPVEMH